MLNVEGWLLLQLPYQSTGGHSEQKIKEKKHIAVCATSTGCVHAIWDHTELPATQQRQRSRPYPSRDQLVLDLSTN